MIWNNLLQINGDRFIETNDRLITKISGSFGFSPLLITLLDSLLFTTDVGAWTGTMGGKIGGMIDSVSEISSPSPVVTLPC